MNCSALYTALNFFGCKLKGTCSRTSVQATRSMPPEMNSQPDHWLHHGLEHGGMIRSLLDCCSSLLAETATWRAEGVTSPSSFVNLLSVVLLRTQSRKSNCRARSCNHTFVAGSALRNDDFCRAEVLKDPTESSAAPQVSPFDSR